MLAISHTGSNRYVNKIKYIYWYLDILRGQQTFEMDSQCTSVHQKDKWIGSNAHIHGTRTILL